MVGLSVFPLGNGAKLMQPADAAFGCSSGATSSTFIEDEWPGLPRHPNSLKACVPCHLVAGLELRPDDVEKPGWVGRAPQISYAAAVGGLQGISNGVAARTSVVSGPCISHQSLLVEKIITGSATGPLSTISGRAEALRAATSFTPATRCTQVAFTALLPGPLDLGLRGK